MMNSLQFLELCQKSSDDTYQAFKWLLSQLEDPSTRVQALEFWHHLFEQVARKKQTSSKKQNKYFTLSHLELRQGEGEIMQLKLLQLPSTFAPEQWSFTFFEGLARCKPTEFNDRIVTELGCGIGWITIALAKQTHPSKIYGLDINPKAILCSKLNLYLNGFDSKGNPTWEHEGSTLLDRVQFHVSDLLEYCRNENIHIDRIIGCIPQVLNPDPEFTTRIMANSVIQPLEQANDEFLYSLSNYTANQGHIEDQFGLGLIARAVEESLDSLKATGKLILNLGGRPGATVLSRLFQRRGFTLNPIWTTRVSQAKDTDIQSLVEIENQTQHRFEFYMGQERETPVSAKTAFNYAKAGGEIAHALTVYEAHPRDPIHLPKILHFMRQEGYENARNSLDLSYSEDTLAVEKMSYLDALIARLKDGTFFPYEETSGMIQFRKRLGSYFRNYYQLHYSFEHILVAPNRTALCRNILSTFRPNKILVDSQIATTLPVSAAILETPRNSGLFCNLLEKIKPEIAIYNMPRLEADSSDLFQKISATAKITGTRVFIDISEWIDFSSNPRSNGVFRYLIQHPLPPHIALFCGLVKNRLYHDLEVCFLITENKTLFQILKNAAELTYSRTPLLSQLYYSQILKDLLNFQITESYLKRAQTRRIFDKEDSQNKQILIQPCPAAKRAFLHPAIVAELHAQDLSLIRLDYGENCLPSPKCLRQAIFEAFSKKQLTHEDTQCTTETLELAQIRFGILPTEHHSITFNDGIAPLFSTIAENFAKKNITLLFPAGSYGHFMASAQFHQTKTQVIHSTEDHSFKLTPQQLTQTLTSLNGPSCLMLTAPIVNPTGAIYSEDELHALFKVVESNQSSIILDSIFSGLEFNFEKNDVHSCIQTYCNLSEFPTLRWTLLGGISKEFAAGGLRIGYGISKDPQVTSIWKSELVHGPHGTLKFALKKVYQEFLHKNPKLLSELSFQRVELKQRSKVLSKVLKSKGWSVLPCSGGLFLSAKPPKMSKSKETQELIEEIFRKQLGVMINPPSWTGIPEYYRFVISTTLPDFKESIKRLSKGK